jgi:polysaccharide export outer membrane protein
MLRKSVFFCILLLALTGTRLLAQGVPLRNGDVVDIRIANVPADDIAQFTGAYTLDENGMINLPYIGLIKAGGMPASAVQSAVQSKLISDGFYTNPIVMVTAQAGERVVTVSGAVRAPSRVQYTSDLTLMIAIDSAGGPSDFAGDGIRLIRAGKVIKYSRKKLEKDPSKDPPIEPGDQIEVMESWW